MWGVSEGGRDMDVPNGGTQSISHRGVTRLQGVAKNGYDMTTPAESTFVLSDELFLLWLVA